MLGKEIRKKKQIVALGRYAGRGNVALLLLEESFGWRVINAGDDIAWLEAGQKAALDNPVSAKGRGIEAERLVALVEPGVPKKVCPLCN